MLYLRHFIWQRIRTGIRTVPRHFGPLLQTAPGPRQRHRDGRKFYFHDRDATHSRGTPLFHWGE